MPEPHALLEYTHSEERTFERPWRGGPVSSIKKELLDILACPQTHAPLVQSGDWLYSTDRDTRRKYPIRDGIPIMLIEESEVAEPDEFDRVIGSATKPEQEEHP